MSSFSPPQETGRLEILYVVENAGPDWKGPVGRVTQSMLQSFLPEAKDENLILVCGPAGVAVGLEIKDTTLF
jgi:NAD(P)H-flavin reductase